ncbi:MAG: nucleotidyltransferase domain-containing protein, partial [Nanoarchaeota archaeon]
MKIINEFLKEKEIIDIIIFGSFVRGKEKPKDIDIIINYTDRFNTRIETNHSLKKKLEKFGIIYVIV